MKKIQAHISDESSDSEEEAMRRPKHKFTGEQQLDDDRNKLRLG